MVDPLRIPAAAACREVVLNIHISFVPFGLSSFWGGEGRLLVREKGGV